MFYVLPFDNHMQQVLDLMGLLETFFYQVRFH